MSTFRRFSSALGALGLTWLLGATAQAADDPADLADAAVAARYTVERLVYEKQIAERTIKGSETNIQQSTKSLPAIREKIAKLERDVQPLREELARKTAAADAAKQRAAAGTADDKSAAIRAEQERQAADLRFRQLDNDLRRETDQAKRNEDRIRQSEADMAAAKQRLPQLQAEIAAARTTADEARARAAAADAARAAGQNAQAIAERIDSLIDARLQAQQIPASPPIEDAEWLRRATLDVVGSVPKYADVVAFLDDASPGKRAALVDRLLDDPGYGRNFAQRFCTVTTENGTSTLNQGRDLFRNWLAESIQANRRWDRTVRDMLSADGRGFEQPAALFTVAYRMNEQPDPALLLSAAGDYFLGLQIQCAQCHDHPYHDEWKHADFWRMAALFGRVRAKGNLAQNTREVEYVLTDDDVDPNEMLRMNGIKYADQLTGGRIGIPDPVNAGEILETVRAQFLDRTSPTLPEKGNHRRAFAAWVTDKQNPYFARAAVNRVWAHFFGRGLVEPIVNLHPDNEASHPDVLNLLADEFRRSDFDLKHLVRCLTLTRAYGRSCKPVPGNEQDAKYASRMAVKPLDSYVLIDSLSVVLRRTMTDNQRRRDDATAFDTRLPGGDPTTYTHSIPQVLRLMNSREHADGNPTVQAVTVGKPLPEAIEHLYLAVLARRPTAAERDEMVAYVGQVGDSRRGLADVFWVLLNGAEFLVNH